MFFLHDHISISTIFPAERKGGGGGHHPVCLVQSLNPSKLVNNHLDIGSIPYSHMLISTDLVGSIIPMSAGLLAHYKCSQNCYLTSGLRDELSTLLLSILNSHVYEEVPFEALPVWPLSLVLLTLFKCPTGLIEARQL